LPGTPVAFFFGGGGGAAEAGVGDGKASDVFLPERVAVVRVPSGWCRVSVSRASVVVSPPRRSSLRGFLRVAVPSGAGSGVAAENDEDDLMVLLIVTPDTAFPSVAVSFLVGEVFVTDLSASFGG
jgi:hypothetical protein